VPVQSLQRAMMGSKVCFSLSVSGAKIPPTRRHGLGSF
jgi:hypothetical protein